MRTMSRELAEGGGAAKEVAVLIYGILGVVD